MPYISIDSTRFYYEVAGNGQPILWLPPLLQDHELMRSFTQPLVETYTSITMDILGHGSSDKPKKAELYSYENLANHCFGLVRHLGIKKHDIIGISWSRRIALTYTLLYQHMVRALVLIGSSGPKHQVTIPPYDPELSETENFVVQTVWQTPYDVLEDLKTIRVSTLIPVGDRDPRLEAAKLMHANIPKSTLTVIQGEGHEIESRLCVEKIRSWLKDLPEYAR